MRQHFWTCILQKEHYMNYYTTIRQKQCKKSELTPIVDEYARAVEAEEGTAMRPNVALWKN